MLLLLVLVGAAAAAIVVLASDDSKSGGDTGAPTPSQVEPTVIATAFDPAGDGVEDSANANNVVTGASPPWSTEHYTNFSEKPGVGLTLDLARELEVSSVAVEALQAGWSAEIYASSKDPSQLVKLADWGQPVASADGVGPSHTFTFDATKARAVLVWFTQLPRGDNDQYLQVAKITVG